jgi:hypothetical protein
MLQERGLSEGMYVWIGVCVYVYIGSCKIGVKVKGMYVCMFPSMCVCVYDFAK